MRTFLTGAALAAMLPAVVFADVVSFKSGSKLTGKVLRIEGGTIHFEADDVGVVKIAEDKVAQLTSDTAQTIEYVNKETEDAVIALSNGVYTASGRTLDMGKVKAVNPEKETWHGSVNLSATAARGNTISEKVTLLADVNRRWEEDRFKANFGYYFSQTGIDHDNRTKDEDRVELEMQEDHFWATKVYSYINGKYERDGVNALMYRYRLGLGMGYQWLDGQTFDKTGKWSFSQEIGGAYIKERYEHQADDDRMTLRYAHHGAWTPNWVENLSFTHNLEYLPDVDDWTESYLIDADIGFTYAFVSHWQLMGKWEWEYNSNPGAHTKSSDFRYVLGLGYKW